MLALKNRLTDFEKWTASNVPKMAWFYFVRQWLLPPCKMSVYKQTIRVTKKRCNINQSSHRKCFDLWEQDWNSAKANQVVCSFAQGYQIVTMLTMSKQKLYFHLCAHVGTTQTWLNLNNPSEFIFTCLHTHPPTCTEQITRLQNTTILAYISTNTNNTDWNPNGCSAL